MKKLFERLFPSRKQSSNKIEQAVLIHLDGVGLSPEVYEKYDLATLEDQLTNALRRNGVGEVDGNEIGEKEVVIFLYGPDAEKIFIAIETILRSYPLCRNAKVVIRYGVPGSSQREIKIA
jgi:hypothetical protein